MKKSTLIIIFLALAILKTQAQDYLISFLGIGDTNVLSIVKVDNLTSGATVTLNGGDILHLKSPAGIETQEMNNNTMSIHPNPMVSQSTLRFSTPENGNAVIGIFDLSGKAIYKISTLLSAGVHNFRISGINQGIYLVKVSGEYYNYSTKLISQSNVHNEARIEYTSSDKITTKNKLKSTLATIDMPYTDGDQLLYQGRSGIYSTVVTDVPNSSKTTTFHLLLCKDSEGKNYATVGIGTQTWMAENLNVGLRINGIQEQVNNGITEKYCYDDNEANCNIYGGIYQWGEIMKYDTVAGIQGICPKGWHIPIDAEWTKLSTFLGGESIAGGKIKSTGTIQAGTGMWNEPNAGANNSSGFTALPGGLRYLVGNFGYLPDEAHFWSSSMIDVTGSWCRYSTTSIENLVRDYDHWANGLSVRCMKD